MTADKEHYLKVIRDFPIWRLISMIHYYNKRIINLNGETLPPKEKEDE